MMEKKWTLLGWRVQKVPLSLFIIIRSETAGLAFAIFQK